MIRNARHIAPIIPVLVPENRAPRRTSEDQPSPKGYGLPREDLKFGTPSSSLCRHLFGIAHATALVFDLSGFMSGRLLNASGEKLPVAESISS